MKSGTNHSQGSGKAGPSASSSDSMPVKPRQSKAAKKPGTGGAAPSAAAGSIGKGSNHHQQPNHNSQPAAAANKAGTKPSKQTGGNSSGNNNANGSKAAQLDVISMGDDGYNHKAAPSLQQKVRVVPGRGEFENRYAMGRQLGLGAFSNVFLGVHKASQQNYAVKKIDREKMIWGDSRDVLEDEVNHLIMARHGPNIVQLYEVYEEKVHCYLVMELMKGGELFDRILERKNFTEANARECVRGILTGLDYLHERYVIIAVMNVHGAAANIMATRAHPDSLQAAGPSRPQAGEPAADFGRLRHQREAGRLWLFQAGAQGQRMPDPLRHSRYVS